MYVDNKIEVKVFIMSDKEESISFNIDRNQNTTVKDLIGSIMNICLWKKIPLKYPTRPDAYALQLILSDDESEDDLDLIFENSEFDEFDEDSAVYYDCNDQKSEIQDQNMSRKEKILKKIIEKN